MSNLLKFQSAFVQRLSTWERRMWFAEGQEREFGCSQKVPWGELWRLPTLNPWREKMVPPWWPWLPNAHLVPLPWMPLLWASHSWSDRVTFTNVSASFVAWGPSLSVISSLVSFKAWDISDLHRSWALTSFALLPEIYQPHNTPVRPQNFTSVWPHTPREYREVQGEEIPEHSCAFVCLASESTRHSVMGGRSLLLAFVFTIGISSGHSQGQKFRGYKPRPHVLTSTQLI